MKAVILAGGLGTRLAEETSVRPKPMVEIGGKPVLWHLLKLYSHVGRLLRFHKSQKCMATLTAVQPPGRFGALDLASGQLVEVGEIARILALAAGRADLLRPSVLPRRAHEPLRLPIRPLALHELGWRHEFDVDRALRASFEHTAAASATSEAMSP